MNHWLKKHYIKILIFLTGIAGLIRLGVGFELLKNDSFVANPPASTDMATYLRLSTEWWNGSFQGPIDYQPFYYTVFLPFVHLFGDGMTPVIIGQSLIGALSIWGVGWLTSHYWGRWAGIFAALLLTFHYPHILYSAYAMYEVILGGWIILLGICSAKLSEKRPIIWQWIITGLFLGCAVLTRGNSWLFLFVLLIVAWKASKYCYGLWSKGWRRWGIVTGLMLIIICASWIPQIPYVIHNTKEVGKLTGPSIAGGKVLALGNSPEAPPGGMPHYSPPGQMEYPEIWQYWINTENEISIFRRISEWAYSEPCAFLELQFRKGLLFWDERDIANNIANEYNGKYSPFLQKIGFIESGIILSLAFAGLLLLIKRQHKKSKIILLIIILLWFGVVVFYNLERFKISVFPILAVLAGSFIGESIMLTRIHTRRQSTTKSESNSNNPLQIRSLLKLSIFLCSGIFISYFAFTTYNVFAEANIMRSIRPHGVHFQLMEHKNVVFDHGPMSMGGWCYWPIKANQSIQIQKRFSFENPPKDIKQAELEITFASKESTEINIEINGEKHSYQLNNGLTKLYIPLQASIQMEKLDLLITPQKPVFLIYDIQRVYNRSWINQKVLDGEWVCRLRYIPVL